MSLEKINTPVHIRAPFNMQPLEILDLEEEGDLLSSGNEADGGGEENEWLRRSLYYIPQRGCIMLRTEDER
ncbi:hypothetical protein FPOAC2_06407 [Fusarium poae]|jgi:hypothetical protein